MCLCVCMLAYNDTCVHVSVYRHACADLQRSDIFVSQITVGLGSIHVHPLTFLFCFSG